MKLVNPRPSSNMVHNAVTLRSRTGLSREGAEDFLCGRQVAGASDKHICGRFGLATRPENAPGRLPIPGKGGHVHAGQHGTGGLGSVPPSLGVLGSGGHIRPVRPVGGVRPTPVRPGTILRRPDAHGEDALIAGRVSK